MTIPTAYLLERLSQNQEVPKRQTKKDQDSNKKKSSKGENHQRVTEEAARPEAFVKRTK